MSEKFKDAEFVGWDMCSILYGVYSKDFDRIYKVPGVNDPSYRVVIQEILDKERPDAVMVLPEVEVLYWAKNPFDVKYITPSPEFCELAISKRKLFNLLKGTGLVPISEDLSREDAFDDNYQLPLEFPMWVRDASAGTASGKGSFKANNITELRAWVMINTGIDNFQISEFCPGGNYGVLCLFENDKLLKCAIAERLEYIMAKVAVSGITGNTSKGRFLNDEHIKAQALDAIERVCKATNSVLNGLVLVICMSISLKMNARECRDILDDKTKFYKHYDSYMVHSVGDVNDLENKPEILAKIYNSPSGKMVFKARDGQCGNSVLVCNTSEMKMEEVVPFMKKNNWDLLEEYVIQHRDISTLSPFAVNTIRVVTQINKDGNVDILACRMRISGRASVDNFSHKSHTGMAAINAETGVIDRPAVKKDNFSEPIFIHPKTGVSIVGFQIPYWKEVLELTKSAALSQPQNRSIGWDVVITDKGPGLIEGNHNWNRDIFHMPVNKGLKCILEDYKYGRK